MKADEYMDNIEKNYEIWKKQKIKEIIKMSEETIYAYNDIYKVFLLSEGIKKLPIVYSNEQLNIFIELVKRKIIKS